MIYFTEIVPLSPVKYNEKMMNSIWGLYNRNSPHNFKKNNAASDGSDGQQHNVAAGVIAASTTAIKTISDSDGNTALALDFSPSLFGSTSTNNEGHCYNENGAFAGYTHSHGHHGNYHRHRNHEHFEETLSFSTI